MKNNLTHGDMEKIYPAITIDGLKGVASEIAPLLENYPVVALHGGMGVGKTTFIKFICLELGVDDIVNSPSFSIINEYITRAGRSVFHFDFYRLRSEVELLELGHEEYFYSGEVCLIEWPEKIGSYLPSERLNIYIEELPGAVRKITVTMLR